MRESTHGHEVLRMLIAADRAFTREDLLREITTRFGSEARFHTCSAIGLTPEGLVDFLVARRKLRDEGGRWVVAEVGICSDDG